MITNKYELDMLFFSYINRHHGSLFNILMALIKVHCTNQMTLYFVGIIEMSNFKRHLITFDGFSSKQLNTVKLPKSFVLKIKIHPVLNGLTPTQILFQYLFDMFEYTKYSVTLLFESMHFF